MPNKKIYCFLCAKKNNKKNNCKKQHTVSNLHM